MALRAKGGHWEGELSSSALATATAVTALHTVDAERHGTAAQAGREWLRRNQNADGGWGDTVRSKSNLSTTLLCWSALKLAGVTSAGAEAWIVRQVGGLEPGEIARAVVARYGKDRTFSVPILMHCAICKTLGPDGWKRVLPLPFELAALPRPWFGAVGLPVVSYALPALIAIGFSRYHHGPPAKLNPLRWLRGGLWRYISPMLKRLQPASGGYLEATPLTSFVTMALASSGEKSHPCLPGAVEFLVRSQRGDGSWPIDTNLATWGTTLAVKATGGDVERREEVLQWLLRQQYNETHPFTNAAPGGWAWTDLPGGVPDADDTAGALIALRLLGAEACWPEARRGIEWLLDLQNGDGGVPTFCRGWGALPFDRSAAEITAHALLAWWTWRGRWDKELRGRILHATKRALAYLRGTQSKEGAWTPLWFGNEEARGEANPVYGTAQVCGYLGDDAALAEDSRSLLKAGTAFLVAAQNRDGGWGGERGVRSTIEETAVTVAALAAPHAVTAGVERDAVRRGMEWLRHETRDGTHFPAAPIGLYFARLWYDEKLYPVIWTLQALRRANHVLSQTE